MGPYRFILISHWQSKKRWFLYTLMIVLTVGTWFVFQQMNQSEMTMSTAATAQNRTLLSGNSTRFLKKMGLSSLVIKSKQVENSSLVMQERNLTNAVIKGNFGLTENNSGLPISNRYGVEGLTTAIRSRHLISKSISPTTEGLISTRYGVKDWSYLVSLLPLITSIFGVLVMTVMVMSAEFSEIVGSRARLVATLPSDKRQLIGVQFSVFLTDLIVFIVTIDVTGFITAHFLGGSISPSYPIITRSGAGLELMPAVQVIVLTTFLFICACCITYLLIRLFITLIYGVRSLAKEMVVIITAYWMLLAQTTLSVLPNLFHSKWLLYVPSTYMQASSLLFGTDYLHGGQQILSSLNMYTDKGVTSHILVSLSVTNLSYYNGATIANLFNVKESLVVPAICMLVGCSVILLAFLAYFAHRKNRLV